MKEAHKKRPPRATANSPPVLPDMGELFYKSEKFINMIKGNIVCHSTTYELLD